MTYIHALKIIFTIKTVKIFFESQSSLPVGINISGIGMARSLAGGVGAGGVGEC